MAHHTPTTKPRHVTRQRRAAKRKTRGEALRHELELREHSPVDPPEHPSRRVTRPRTPLWKILRSAVGVLLVLAVGELAVASLTAKQFGVKSLEVSGCVTTESKQVLEIGQELVGQNWIRANTRQVASEIETIPTVKKAHISRALDWPPRLHITVEERVAFAKVGAGENWWVVDKDGVAFRTATAEDKDLYCVTSPKLAPQAGKALPESEWRPVVDITSALQARDGEGWSLRRIYFDKDGSAALRLAGGFHDETLVRLGSDHWQEKLVRAHQALDYFQKTGKHAAVLNLVSYEMPQWTPRTPVTKQAANPENPSADTASET